MDDYISRQRTKDYIKSQDSRLFIGLTIGEAVQMMIDEVPAADVSPTCQWISVEDRLPENGVDVLCWYEYYHWSKEKVLPEYGIGYCFNGMWGGEVSNGRDCNVLYWMPLPEPPFCGADMKGGEVTHEQQ